MALQASKLLQNSLIGWYEPKAGTTPVKVIGTTGEYISVILNGQQVKKHQNHQSFREIPLTEEWLMALGFDNKDYKSGYIGIDLKHTDFVLSYPKTEVEYSDFFCFNYQRGRLVMYNEFKFVHELQNFFLLVTGEELNHGI